MRLTNIDISHALRSADLVTRLDAVFLMNEKTINCKIIEALTADLEALIAGSIDSRGLQNWQLATRLLRALAVDLALRSAAQVGYADIVADRTRLQVLLQEVDEIIDELPDKKLQEELRATYNMSTTQVNKKKLRLALGRLPLPTLYFAEKQPRGVNRSAPGESAPLPNNPVLRLAAFLDNLPVTVTQTLRPHTLHTLRFHVSGTEWPENAQSLRIELLSTCPPSLFHFSVFETCDHSIADIFESELAGNLQFNATQSEGAADLLVAVRVAFVMQDKSMREVHVVGHNQLRFRLSSIIDSAKSGQSSSAPELASERVGEDAREDPLHNDLTPYNSEEQPWYIQLPSTKDIRSDELLSLSSDIDIVLITATDTELNAVLRLLEPYPQNQSVLKGFAEQETYYLGKFGCYRAAVTKCRVGSLASGGATLATEYAQRLWRPRALVMVGIGFGMDPEKQKIADVLVASQIISYEPQRVEEHGCIQRGPITPSDTTLLNRFENVLSWSFCRPDGSKCKRVVGTLLSGEKLVDSESFKRSLLGKYPQAIGGDMEGVGFVAAAERAGVSWILVKAICDWADGRKNKKHQPLSAAAAASLVHHVLSQTDVLYGLHKPNKYH